MKGFWSRGSLILMLFMLVMLWMAIGFVNSSGQLQPGFVYAQETVSADADGPVVGDLVVPETTDRAKAIANLVVEKVAGNIKAPDTTGIGIFGVAGMIAVLIPFLIGLIKKATKLSKGWCPLLALVLGVLFGVAAFYMKMAGPLSLIQSMLAGVAVGGTSTGLYDVKKQTAKAVFGEK